MAVAVDAAYVAGHLGLDEPIITSLTTAPTVELVASLLQAVEAKARDYDDLFAQKLQADIELENAIRTSETRTASAQNVRETALKEVEEARQTLREERT
jgi:nucleoprotein TPR